MKKISVYWSILFVCFCIIFFGLHMIVYASDACLSDEDGLETTPQRLPEKMLHELLDEQKVIMKYDAYPRELYFGDTLYIGGYIKIISEEAVLMEEIWDEDEPFIPSWIRITSDKLDNNYESRLINSDVLNILDEHGLNEMDACWDLTFRIYHPGEKFYFAAFYPEICPLREYEHPFWKELKNKMTAEGIDCHVGCYRTSSGMKPLFEFDIKIKPRPESEMELLRTWYESTPAKQFSLSWESQSGARNKIRLSKFSLKSYEPGMFIRTGYRKPWVPNNPRTLDGWRKLESSIIPSTMHDEITMIRFNIELFAARGNDVARKRVRNEYAEWLNSLPELQRTVMLLEYIYYNPGKVPAGRAMLGVGRDTLGASDFMVPIEK